MLLLVEASIEVFSQHEKAQISSAGGEKERRARLQQQADDGEGEDTTSRGMAGA